MNELIQNTSYDTWTIIIAVLFTIIGYLWIKHIPQHYYKLVKGLRLVQQSELDRLHQTIAGLESTLAIHMSAPIKEEKSGQLSFTQMVEPAQRTVKLPQDRQIVLAAVKDATVPVFILENGHYKKSDYTLPDATPIKTLSKDGKYILIANPYKDGQNLPPLYVQESSICLERGYQVWNITDLQKSKEGFSLVRRNKRREWVEKVERDDQIIKPYRWVRAENN